MPQEALAPASELSERLHAALSLAERAQTLRRAERPPTEPDADAARAAGDTIRLWKAQKPFPTGNYFEQRLQLDGLTEQDLLLILALPHETYSASSLTTSTTLSTRTTPTTPTTLATPTTLTTPPWIRDLEDAYLNECPLDEDLEFAHFTEKGTNGFVCFAQPLIAPELCRFRAVMSRFAGQELPFDPATAERLVLPRLMKILKNAVAPVMVLELHIARQQGLLEGETGEERFRAFCERLRRPEIRLAIGCEYPVLLRGLQILIKNWADYSLELLERLAADWNLIRTSLGCADLGCADGSVKLVAIEAGAGDSHRQGRTVAILEFSSGFKLAYKPHSQLVDIHFGEFLGWINRAGFETPFRILEILDRGSYAWSEFAAHKLCSSREEIERFYHRLGGYLAVFYALQAGDMHSENLIAAGEFPVPVDLETLFHPMMSQEDDPATKSIQDSVLRISLLPGGRRDASGKEESVDTSGIGGGPGQYHPLGKTESWHAEGTDEMRLVRDKLVPVKVHANRPQIRDQDIRGQDVTASEHVEDFVAGFEWVYRLIERHAEELRSPGGLVDRFANDEVRYIARDTMAYDRLVQASKHPDRLRNALDRDRLLDGLWIAAAKESYLIRLIPSELRDLQGGDIPAFTFRPDSRHLWNSRGECIPEVFERPPIEMVGETLSNFGEQDLARQVEIIRRSIASLEAGGPAVLH